MNGSGQELSWGQLITGAEPHKLLWQEPQSEQGLGFKSLFTQHMHTRSKSTVLSVSLCHFTSEVQPWTEVTLHGEGQGLNLSIASELFRV